MAVEIFEKKIKKACSNTVKIRLSDAKLFKTNNTKAPSTPIQINLKKKQIFLIWSSVHTNPAFYLPKTDLFENALSCE